MNIERLCKRSLFHFQKRCIGALAYVDSRLYMWLYNRLLRRNGLTMNGVPRFIANTAVFDDFERITVGDRLVVSMGVHFLTHDYSYTTALISIDQQPPTDIGVQRNIVIGNNVFVGMNTIILPGSVVGNHVIVGAGSVVRGFLRDYSIVAGNPAVVVGDIREYARKVESRSEQTLNRDKS